MQRDRCHLMQLLGKEGYVLLIATAQSHADKYKVDIYKALYPKQLGHSLGRKQNQIRVFSYKRLCKAACLALLRTLVQK